MENCVRGRERWRCAVCRIENESKRSMAVGVGGPEVVRGLVPERYTQGARGILGPTENLKQLPSVLSAKPFT